MWNVPYVNIFIPAWIVPPIYHGIRRESARSTKSGDELGVKACRPAWFEDESVARLTPTDAAQRPAPMHGLRLYFLCTTTTQTNQGTQNQKRKDVNDIFMPKLVPKKRVRFAHSFSFHFNYGETLKTLGVKHNLQNFLTFFLKEKTASQRRLHSFHYYSFSRGISLILLPSKICAYPTARDQCAFSTKSHCHLLDIAVTLPPNAKWGEKAKEYGTIHRRHGIKGPSYRGSKNPKYHTRCIGGSYWKEPTAN